MVKAILLLSISSILLTLSFPPTDSSLLMWFALVPLVVFTHNRRSIPAFVFFFSCGVVFFTGLFRWVLHFPGFTLVHQAILGIYVGLFFGIFGLSFSWISRRISVPWGLFAAPFLWVPLEYLRTHLGFMSLPWGLLGYSQYNHPVIIQIASVAGVYGVSFLIVMVNSAVAALVLVALQALFKRRGPDPHHGVTLGAGIALVAVALVLVAGTLVYGRRALNKPLEEGTIRVSLVQGNIEQAKKWDRRYAAFIRETYEHLTREASAQHPDLIIWPETATAGVINRDVRLRSWLKKVARSANAPIMVGSAQYQKLGKRGNNDRKYFNSAFLIQPEEKLADQRYDKIRLMPFGEYVPLRHRIPWSLIGVPDGGSYVPGTEFTVFETKGFRFGVTICWENLFPDLVRRFVEKGAQFVVNITNEAWFGESVAPYQFLSMNVFRAVENRRYVVRCANTGISCFIDPAGRIKARVRDQAGKDVFVRGTLTGTVQPRDSLTFYTRHGDLLVWISTGCSFIFLISALLGRPKKPSDTRTMSR
jgi:apolipoprotein N-acyltransferase